MSLTFPVDAKLKDGSPVQLVRLMSGMSSRSDSSTGMRLFRFITHA